MAYKHIECCDRCGTPISGENRSWKGIRLAVQGEDGTFQHERVSLPGTGGSSYSSPETQFEAVAHNPHIPEEHVIYARPYKVSITIPGAVCSVDCFVRAMEDNIEKVASLAEPILAVQPAPLQPAAT